MKMMGHIIATKSVTDTFVAKYNSVRASATLSRFLFFSFQNNKAPLCKFSGCYFHGKFNSQSLPE